MRGSKIHICKPLYCIQFLDLWPRKQSSIRYGTSSPAGPAMAGPISFHKSLTCIQLQCHFTWLVENGIFWEGFREVYQTARMSNTNTQLGLVPLKPIFHLTDQPHQPQPELVQVFFFGGGGGGGGGNPHVLCYFHHSWFAKL